VTVAVESDCTETDADEVVKVMPGAWTTCNVTFWLAVNPSPAADTIIVSEASAAVDGAVKVSVSELELTLVEGVKGFADHAAVTPPGSPLTLQVTFPVNEPPVAAVRLTVPVDPCATTTVLEAADTASVGGVATVSA